ncbi:DICT sensory domain-containing protein [Natrialbaceae archaeon A-CW1-1]
MDTLTDAFERVERRRKTLEVYAVDDSVRSELERQFSTRNVRIVHHAFPSKTDLGFVVIRDSNGEFRAALGLEKLQAIISPEIQPPWELSDLDSTDVFDFLENTIFTAYDRRQMLAATREIEERAWRTDSGTLHTGFQTSTAFAKQAPIYDRFAHDSSVSVRVFFDGDPAVTNDSDSSLEVTPDAGAEIGEHWFVLFDGGPTDRNASGLLAREREPGRYYGFWTYDPGFVEEIMSYVRTAVDSH